MKSDVIAALSLSAKLTKDSLMQAVGRLRKLGRNQKLLIVLTKEVKLKIEQMYGFEENWPSKEKVKAILNWACLNSLKENERYFLENAKLAADHLHQLESLVCPYTNKTDFSLTSLYSSRMVNSNIAELSEKLLLPVKITARTEAILHDLQLTFKRYGSTMELKLRSCDAICER